MGSHILFQLVRNGELVKAIYRDSNSIQKVEKLFSYYTKDYQKLFQEITWVEADILDIPSLEEAFDTVTKVYHAAALISFNPKDWLTLRKNNVEGTKNIVNLCLDMNITKLCYASSTAAIGKSANNEEVTEDNEWVDSDLNVYAISKHLAEMEVWRGSQEGLDVVIVNPGIILGPGNWNKGSSRLFKNAAKGMRSYFPGGTGFISANDVATIMIKLMDSTIKNERYITIAKNLSYKEVFSMISTSFGMPVPQKRIPFWLLECLWRIDWFLSNLLGKKRKLTKSTVKSLQNTQEYSHKKIKEALQYQFEDLKPGIDVTCKILKEEYSEKF